MEDAKVVDAQAVAVVVPPVVPPKEKAAVERMPSWDASALSPAVLARINYLKAQIEVYRGLNALAEAVVKAGGGPKNVSAGQAFVAMCTGVAVGVDPMVALSKIVVVNGTPSIYWDTAQALLRQRGLISGKGFLRERYEGKNHAVLDPDDQQAVDAAGDDFRFVAHAKRADTGEEMERSFSVRDAKRAKLWGKQGPWSEFGLKRMLRYRGLGFLSRDLFADVTMGLHLREELLGEPFDDTTTDDTSTPPTPPTGGNGPDPLFSGDAPPEAPAQPVADAQPDAAKSARAITPEQASAPAGGQVEGSVDAQIVRDLQNPPGRAAQPVDVSNVAPAVVVPSPQDVMPDGRIVLERDREGRPVVFKKAPTTKPAPPSKGDAFKAAVEKATPAPLSFPLERASTAQSPFPPSDEPVAVGVGIGNAPPAVPKLSPEEQDDSEIADLKRRIAEAQAKRVKKETKPLPFEE